MEPNDTEYTLNNDEQAIVRNIGTEIAQLQAEATAYLNRVAKVRGLNGNGNWNYDASTFKFTKLKQLEQEQFANQQQQSLAKQE